MIKVGVGILAFNRPRALNRILNMIFMYDYSDLQYEIEFVVSIDGNNQETIEIAKKFPVTILNNGKHIGIPSNRNRLISYMRNKDIVFMIEEDMLILHKDWINKYVEALINNENILFLSYGRGVDIRFGYDKKIDKNIAIYSMKERIVNNYKEQFPIVFFVYKQELIDIVGGFNEIFPKYGRDHIEFGYRLTKYKLKEEGSFYDLIDSSKYIYLSFTDVSSVKGKKNVYLREADKIFNDIDFSKFIIDYNKYENQVLYESPWDLKSYYKNLVNNIICEIDENFFLKIKDKALILRRMPSKKLFILCFYFKKLKICKEYIDHYYKYFQFPFKQGVDLNYNLLIDFLIYKYKLIFYKNKYYLCKDFD